MVKRIIFMIIGIALLGIGTAFFKLSSFGHDTVGALVFSFVYLFDKEFITYFVCYVGFNLIILIPMIIFSKDKIGIATVAGILLVGFACDLVLYIFSACGVETIPLWLRIVFIPLSLFTISVGIALYMEADLGVCPYDELPFIIQKIFPKIRFQWIKIGLDFTTALIAFVVGVLILKRTDIININTIISFICFGPLIAFVSKFINKYIYKKDTNRFN